MRISFRRVNALFFFKQKTAYEMRNSDWSSDVCSSDLLVLHERDTALVVGPELGGQGDGLRLGGDVLIASSLRTPLAEVVARRSEEHTSELQSLMRTSYAVFCLYKKNHNTLLTPSLSYLHYAIRFSTYIHPHLLND